MGNRMGTAGSKTQDNQAKQNDDWSAYSNIFEIRAVKKLTYEDKVRQKTIEMRLTSPTAPEAQRTPTRN